MERYAITVPRMTKEALVEDPRLAARALLDHSDLDLWDLWLKYLANGGCATSFEFEAFLQGVREPSTLDLELLAFAIADLNDET